MDSNRATKRKEPIENKQRRRGAPIVCHERTAGPSQLLTGSWRLQVAGGGTSGERATRRRPEAAGSRRRRTSPDGEGGTGPRLTRGSPGRARIARLGTRRGCLAGSGGGLDAQPFAGVARGSPTGSPPMAAGGGGRRRVLQGRDESRRGWKARGRAAPGASPEERRQEDGWSEDLFRWREERNG